MKKWQEPSIKDLNISSTKNDDVCLYPNTVFTPLPEGNGKCPKLNSEGKCTHQNYGNGNTQWPCEKATTTTPEIPGIS